MVKYKMNRIPITALLITLIFVLITPISVAEENAASLRLEPASVEIEKVTKFKVDIVLDSGPHEVYGAQYRLTFDPDILKASSQNKSTFLSHNGTETIEIVNTIDNDAGTIDYGITRIGSKSGVKGSGLLSSISFEVREGQLKGSYINLTGVKVSDNHAEKVTTISENCTLIVDEDDEPISSPVSGGATGGGGGYVNKPSTQASSETEEIEEDNKDNVIESKEVVTTQESLFNNTKTTTNEEEAISIDTEEPEPEVETISWSLIVLAIVAVTLAVVSVLYLISKSNKE